MKNIFKKFTFVDLIILLGVIVALFVGLCTFKQVRQTADKQIEATSAITFQVFLRGVTVTGDTFPITQNDKTFITIRNIPYTELEVTGVSSKPRETISPNSKFMDKVILIPDPAQPALYDAVVTIKDVAKITRDGAVVGGNKIKMGLPVTLEGEKYKFNGTISDVRVTGDTGVDNSLDDNIG